MRRRCPAMRKLLGGKVSILRVNREDRAHPTLA
jgi:hypothetical protein